jgi:hypothetical protein
MPTPSALAALTLSPKAQKAKASFEGRFNAFFVVSARTVAHDWPTFAELLSDPAGPWLLETFAREVFFQASLPRVSEQERDTCRDILIRSIAHLQARGEEERIASALVKAIGQSTDLAWPLVEVLLCNAGLDITVPRADLRGRSFFVAFAATPSPESLGRLLAQTPALHAVLSQVDDRGWNALDYAADRGDLKTARLLIEQGLPFERPTPHATVNLGSPGERLCRQKGVGPDDPQIWRAQADAQHVVAQAHARPDSPRRRHVARPRA